MPDPDQDIRVAAFDFVQAAAPPPARTITWKQMVRGFDFKGVRVPLASMQGIFKPAVMELPLSIRSEPQKEGKVPKYEDCLSPDGFLVYKYRRSGAAHSENEGLRSCMREKIPLIYFYGLMPGLYEVRWPVRVLDDDRSAQEFHLSIDEGLGLGSGGLEPTAGLTLKRAYATRTVLQRMHQDGFRARVMAAYRTQCAVCKLRHEELLQAAHIIPDGDPRGEPIVQNGISMCGLHHAAFDEFVLGIRPDRVIEIRGDVLDEEDGPMLVHGLQEFHGKSLADTVKRSWRPRPEFLEEKYAAFRKAV